MSNQRRPTNSPTARARRQTGAARSNGTTWLIVGVVVVIGAALVLALVLGRSDATSNKTTAEDAGAVVKQLTAVPASVHAQVGTGDVKKLPQKIDAPPLTADGKPQVLFVGAEYCPYCAAERWALVEALSRFGTFTGLEVTHSSSSDIYPSTKTLSFVHATYRSDLLSFASVELQGNELEGGAYPTLQTLTAAQEKLFRTYDAPPYVAANSAGSIPFIDFGGRYLVSGASYDPGVLQDKSALEIAKALHDPTSDVAKSAIGTANVLTAVLCDLTNGQPGSVCAAEPVAAIQQQLK